MSKREETGRSSWRDSIVVAIIMIFLLTIATIFLISFLQKILVGVLSPYFPFPNLAALVLSLLPVIVLFVIAIPLYFRSIRRKAERAFQMKPGFIQLEGQLLGSTPSLYAKQDASLVREGLGKATENMRPVCKGYGFLWPAAIYFGKVREGLGVLRSRDPSNYELFIRALSFIENEYRASISPPPEVLRSAQTLHDSLIQYSALLISPPTSGEEN